MKTITIKYQRYVVEVFRKWSPLDHNAKLCYFGKWKTKEEAQAFYDEVLKNNKHYYYYNPTIKLKTFEFNKEIDK